MRGARENLLRVGRGRSMTKTTFTLAEAARLLNCHPETLRRAVRDGSLQAARLGRGYRLSRADLQAFWTAQGGGQLFDQDVEADAAGEDAPERASEKKRGKKSRESGYTQLSLIAPQGRDI